MVDKNEMLETDMSDIDYILAEATEDDMTVVECIDADDLIARNEQLLTEMQSDD